MMPSKFYYFSLAELNDDIYEWYSKCKICCFHLLSFKLCPIWCTTNPRSPLCTLVIVGHSHLSNLLLKKEWKNSIGRNNGVLNEQFGQIWWGYVSNCLDSLAGKKKSYRHEGESFLIPDRSCNVVLGFGTILVLFCSLVLGPVRLVSTPSHSL